MANATSLMSPRLEVLRHKLDAGSVAALEDFWRDAGQHGTPLIEPLSDDGRSTLVTFVWRGGDDSEGVALVSNLNGQMGASEPLARLPGTDLWHRTYCLPNDTRESYQFNIGSGNLTDPLNSRQFVFPGDPEIGFTGWVSSMFELPEAPAQPWIDERPDTPRGQVNLHRIRDDALNHEYRVWVYTPPGYTTDGAPYGWLLIFDGWFYLNLIPAPTILDNLLAAGCLPPLVAVLIGHPWDPYRRRDLACYPPFENFLLHEIVPWVRQNFHVTDDPARAAVVGASLGGTMAAYMGLHHAAIFGNVLTQSAFFGWKPTENDEDDWIRRQYAAGLKLPLRFSIEAGLFETDLPSPLPGFRNLLVSNRRMREALRAKQYNLHYSEFSGGHTPLNWRGTLANGLLALLGTSAL